LDHEDAAYPSGDGWRKGHFQGGFHSTFNDVSRVQSKRAKVPVDGCCHREDPERKAGGIEQRNLTVTFVADNNDSEIYDVVGLVDLRDDRDA
jgi:hypothetical protein